MDFTVFVKTSTGQRHEVDVRSSDTVQDLKIRLQVQTRIPIENMCITFENKILEDGHKLSECGTQPKSVLILWIRPRETGLSFTVETEMEPEHEVHMDSLDPIKTLKLILQEITECPTNRQKLTFKGRRLEDDRPLSAYGIQQASVVHMMIHKNNDIVVIVKTPEGKKLFIDLDLCDTVENLKVKIQDHDGTPIDDIWLIFADKQLEDGRTVSDYNITHLSTVQHVLRLRGGWLPEDEDEGENRGRSLSMDNLANFNHETPRWCQIS